MSLLQNNQDHRMLHDRRAEPPELSIWWNQLSLAQKFSANSLGQFGYELRFIRHDEGNSFAVFYCNDAITVVGEDGSINTSPTIIVR